MRRRKNKRNSAAVLALICLLFIAFVSPLIQTKVMGESLSDPNAVMINLIEDVFNDKVNYDSSSETTLAVMAITFLLIVGLYFLSGFGIIYSRYARYASYLTIAYLFLGLYLIRLLNRESTMELLGITLRSTAIDSGIYLVPIVGILYLYFKRSINRKFRF